MSGIPISGAKIEKKVVKLTAFQCLRCTKLNQIELCFCRYPFFIPVEKSQEEYCGIFGHVSHSPVLKTVEEGRAVKEVCRCLGCGEEFKRDPPITEPIGCGNCKKESAESLLHDDCLKY